MKEPLVSDNKPHIRLKAPSFIQSAYAQGTPEVGTKKYFTIDGVALSATYFDGSGYGSITPSQLLPNTPHTITVDDYGVLAIVYRVP
jgi:hypothetical protein